mmetsp:Transcript_31264/g.38199  ORF Transcript_31264/g.38199 Transcript_31264/m.38199 type:complete len:333 (+) Transcript_31264:41-1039(+)
MPQSYQQSAGSGKAAKFVAANPLAPIANPFSGVQDDNDNDIRSALAENVDRRLKNAVEELQHKHATGTNDVDPTDRAPTGDPYKKAAAEERQRRLAVEKQRCEESIEARRCAKEAAGILFRSENADDYEKEKDGSSSDDDDDLLLDDPALDAIRMKRLAQLKSQQMKQAENRAKGHGEVRTISQDEFLPECTGSSEHVVVHFFSDEFMRCKIMDQHLRIVAPLHLECKFLRIDVHKCPFFVQKLQVKTLPTVICFREGLAVDRLVGFQGLVSENGTGDVDKWKTGQLREWLAKSGMIEYEVPKGEVLAEMERLGLKPHGAIWGDEDEFDEDD